MRNTFIPLRKKAAVLGHVLLRNPPGGQGCADVSRLKMWSRKNLEPRGTDGLEKKVSLWG